MNHDIIFRGILAGVLVWFTLGGVVAFGRRPRAEFVTRRKSRLRLITVFSLFWAAASLLYVVAPGLMDWSALSVPDPWRWVGAGLTLASLLFVTWAFSTLGRNYAPDMVIKKSHTLVTKGPYRWVRHPGYSGYLVLGISLFLLSANWFIGATWLAVGIVSASRIGEEEAMLIERFGDAYRAYMQRTGRFLPRILRRL